MRIALVVLLPVTVALAGCGASVYAAGTPAKAPASVAAAKQVTVTTRHGALGTYLVDGAGRTLYRFGKDSGRRSRCSGACAQAWPPLTSRGAPRAGGGAKASRLSTSRRAGGARQVLYAGHPLYRYAGDGGPGKTAGQGLTAFGARWFVVAPSGRTIRSTPAAAPAPTTSPSPYGY
jgi:predicted lipoprotein with Yx(FWY)xxD motif